MQRDPQSLKRYPGGGYQDGLNLYMYQRAMPTTFFDPSGLACEKEVCPHPGCKAIYGAYCGPHYSGGLCAGCPGPPSPPVDATDSCCAAHDGCYSHGDDADNTECNEELCACLDNIPEDERPWVWPWLRGTCASL